MKPINEIRMILESRSVNEGFARTAVGAFASQLDPTVEELGDLKTAVSEAVTNCIVHAYPDCVGFIYITAQLFENNSLKVRIRDSGIGIADIKQAMTPLFTTQSGERAGLGFAVMESFMDKIRVSSTPGRGTSVIMVKHFGGRQRGE